MGANILEELAIPIYMVVQEECTKCDRDLCLLPCIFENFQVINLVC
jgi:hypothetical protein